MLLKNDCLEGIRAGTITLVFRRWRRATVKAGGQLTTRLGVLAIGSVKVVDPARISAADARRAGYATREDLLAQLTREGDCYRIEVSWAGADPRIALRQDTELDLPTLLEKLARLDRASPRGPWTWATLELIAARPAELAADIAASIGRDKPTFKADVRKLKALGLTESLKVGYRLSPRGQALLHSRGAGVSTIS
ncbi:MAG: hypothetical protein AMXMBFR33_61410 [Candidatus Xenobia bacterium]